MAKQIIDVFSIGLEIATIFMEFRKGQKEEKIRSKVNDVLPDLINKPVKNVIFDVTENLRAKLSEKYKENKKKKNESIIKNDQEVLWKYLDLILKELDTRRHMNLETQYEGILNIRNEIKGYDTSQFLVWIETPKILINEKKTTPIGLFNPKIVEMTAAMRNHSIRLLDIYYYWANIKTESGEAKKYYELDNENFLQNFKEKYPQDDLKSDIQEFEKILENHGFSPRFGFNSPQGTEISIYVDRKYGQELLNIFTSTYSQLGAEEQNIIKEFYKIFEENPNLEKEEEIRSEYSKRNLHEKLGYDFHFVMRFLMRIGAAFYVPWHTTNKRINYFDCVKIPNYIFNFITNIS